MLSRNKGIRLQFHYMRIYILTYIYNFRKLAAKFQAWPLLCAPQLATCCRWALEALLHASLFMVNLYQFKEISLFRHLHINSVKLWFQISIESPEWGPQNTPQWHLQRKQNHGGWAWLTVRRSPTRFDCVWVAYSHEFGAPQAQGVHCDCPLTTRSTKKHNFNENIFCDAGKWQAKGQTGKRANGLTAPKRHCVRQLEYNIPWIMKCRRESLTNSPHIRTYENVVHTAWNAAMPLLWLWLQLRLGNSVRVPPRWCAMTTSWPGRLLLLCPIAPIGWGQPASQPAFICSSIKINQSAFLETKTWGHNIFVLCGYHTHTHTDRLVCVCKLKDDVPGTTQSHLAVGWGLLSLAHLQKQTSIHIFQTALPD